MKMTDEGLTLIMRFEGFRETAYLCPAGVWTIGYGHTARSGPPGVAQGMTMPEEEARVVLGRDVERFAADVRLALRRDISDRQFSALVSFAYNVGSGAFRSSSVLKAVNAGDFEAVPRRLQLWVKAGGKVLPGLVRRRAAEVELFIAGGNGSVDEPAGPPEPVTGKPAHRSSTVLSALAVALTALVSGMTPAVPGWISIVPLLILAVASAWIIRERRRTSREDGI